MKFEIAALAFMLSTSSLAGGRWPADVQRFVDTRQGCDHFRGEPSEAGDEPGALQRREYIARKTEELCRGTDRRLAALRHKYQGDAVVMKRLDRFGSEIEAPAAGRR